MSVQTLSALENAASWRGGRFLSQERLCREQTSGQRSRRGERQVLQRGKGLSKSKGAGKDGFGDADGDDWCGWRGRGKVFAEGVERDRWGRVEGLGGR